MIIFLSFILGIIATIVAFTPWERKGVMVNIGGAREEAPEVQIRIVSVLPPNIYIFNIRNEHHGIFFSAYSEGKQVGISMSILNWLRIAGQYAVGINGRFADFKISIYDIASK